MSANPSTGSSEPRGELASRIVAMPANINPSGDIFGGWIMSVMDVSGGITAARIAAGRVVTVAVSRMVFMQPVKVGDVVCCYTALNRTGRSSITLDVEVWVLRHGQEPRFKVTEAEIVYVAVDAAGRPRPLSGESAAG